MNKRKIKLRKLTRRLGVYHNYALGWRPRRVSRLASAKSRLDGSYYTSDDKRRLIAKILKRNKYQ